MRPGDIALYRPHDRRGHLIAAITSARYCHVRLIVDEDGSTVEADFKGAIRGHVQTGDVIASPPMTDEQRAQIATTATAMVGIPYGFADIIALGLAQFGLTLPILRKRLGRPDRLFCSQLVDVAWRAVGFSAFTDGRLPQNVSPGDLADLAFTHEWPTTTFQS